MSRTAFVSRSLFTHHRHSLGQRCSASTAGRSSDSFHSGQPLHGPGGGGGFLGGVPLEPQQAEHRFSQTATTHFPLNIVHSSNTLARATASLTYFAMTAVFRNAVVTASLPWLDGRSITARTALAFSSVAQSVAALAAMVGGSDGLLASTTKSAQTLPVEGSPPLVPSLPAQTASLPVGHGLDMYSAALEPHFKAVQLNASRTVYKIKISPANLHMTCREGKCYCALVFKDEWEPTLAIVRPHVSICFSFCLSDFAEYWRLKHRLSMLLNERDITTYFTMTTSHQYKFVLDGNSELAVLCRMLQEEVADAHNKCVREFALDMPAELHMSFYQVGHHNV